MRRRAAGYVRGGVLGAAVALLLGATAGCGGGPKTYPVEGKVVYADGTPATDLAGFKVEFEALDTKAGGKGISAEGEIEKDGGFRLTTFKPKDGAVLGRHRVLIAPPMPEGDTVARPHPIDLRYLSYEKSGLEAAVEAKTNEVTLTLTRRKK